MANISNDISSRLISGTSGADSIQNYGGHYSTINAGAGDDSIYNGYYSHFPHIYAAEVMVNGGAGNDSIENETSYSTVDGGTGDDKIWNTGYDNLFIYSGGNDTIWGFSKTSTLQIGDGTSTYSSIQSGSDIIISAGDGSITLVGAANLPKVNIKEIKIPAPENSSWTLSGTTATYGTSDETFVTVSGVKSLDGLSINGNVVTVANSSLNQDSTVSISGDYILALGSNVTRSTTTPSGWNFDGTTATYQSSYTTAGYFLSSNGKSISYNEGSTPTTLVTVKGINSLDGLSLEDKVVTVSESALGTNTVLISGNGYTLKLADDVTLSKTIEAEWDSLVGTTATYKSSYKTEGYTLASNGKSISYNEGSTPITLVTVTGVISTEGLSVKNDVVTVSATSLSQDSTVTISDGYTLKLADDVPKLTTKAAGWRINNNVASYVDSSTVEGYSINDNQIVYTSTGGGDTLVTVNGVTSTDGLEIDFDKKIVTVSTTSLSQDSTVTISEGYTLALANDVPKPTAGSVEWTLNGTNAIGTILASTAGYKLEDNQISYASAGTNNSVVVYGVTSTEDLSVSGNVVTVSKKSLDGVEDPVRISEGYELSLASDVLPPISTEETWTYKDNTVTYQSATRTAGYSLEDNRIIYVGAKDNETAHIQGVKSEEGIVRNGDTFIISSSALTSSDVTITESDYKLALSEDVSAPIKTPANWQLNESTAIYNTASTTEGYKLSDNKIVYTSASGGNNLVTVAGIKSEEGLFLNEDTKLVTIYNSALNGTDITLSGDDYKLELADEVDKPTLKPDWLFDGTTATYQEGATYEGYELSDDGKTIKHFDATDGDIKLELDGISIAPTFADDNQTILELAEINIEGDVSILSNSGYEFEIATGRYSEITFGGDSAKDIITNHGEDIIFDLSAGNDSISNDGSNITIIGGSGNDKIDNSGINVEINAGAGNDNVTLSGETGGNLFIYNVGDGNDNIVGLTKDDTIKIVDAAQVTASVKGDDVVLKVDSGSITIKDGAKSDAAAITLVDSDDNAIEAISGNVYSKAGVRTDDTIVLAATFDSVYTADEVEIVDGSQLTKGISIDGGANGISLIGGVGKDTLINGETDGFELTGGKGNDVFVFTGKKGAITDYSQKGTKGGKDKISLGGGLTLASLTGYETSGENVILDFGDGKELTLRDGLSKYVTFGTKSTTIRSFKENGIFDDKDKGVTLASGQDSFAATRSYSNIESIDGSFTYGINITGNSNDNLIIAGKGDSTLNGSKGADTLVGGDSSDVFVYDKESGNKLIQNFDGDQDRISLTGGAVLSEVKTNENDLELKVGNNKITIDGGAGKEFIFTEKGEDKIFTADGLIVNSDSASLTRSFEGNEFDLSKYNYTSVNASLLRRDVSLTGDADTNSLVGGKGNDTLTAGSGGTSLWGGKGNDVLIGDVGADKFIFRAGDGSDSIQGFDSLDELIIQDKRGRKSTYNRSSFSDGTLTLSIKGGGKVILSGVNDGDAVRINEETHHISGKKLI